MRELWAVVRDEWRFWRANRRFQKECPHPYPAVRNHLIDLGRRKRYWCTRCGKRWLG